MPLTPEQEREIYGEGNPEAGMTDAQFRRAKRVAAQAKADKATQKLPGEVLERMRLKKETGTPYRPEEQMLVPIRDAEILAQPAVDSRDKAALKETMARVERSVADAEKKNRTEYLGTEFDKIVDCVHIAFELEKAGHTKKAMDKLDEINATHTERVLAREITEVTLDGPDSEAAADEA